MTRWHLGAGVSLLALSLLTSQALAQDAPKPVWAPMPPALPAAQDVPYPGTIKISVDATDTDHRIFQIHETIPVTQAGDLILLAPKWLPGDHEPDGIEEVQKMAGFMFAAGGQNLTWSRDPVDINAFHVNVPAGVTEISADFKYLGPVSGDVGRIVITPNMLNLQWTFASLYPAGYYASRIPFTASVTLPAGWQQGSALDIDSSSGNTINFKTVPYDVLIDSPMFAGRYFKRIDLDPGAPVPVHLDIVADKADMLDVPDDVVAVHRKLVQQAYKLYGSHHYDHYDLLAAATDELGGIGLEHHRSSENSVDTEYFTDFKDKFYGRDLFAHEFTHSWNGKFRRPNDLWTPDYQAPMRDSLLWVYEGQTEYWGNVLAARSGLFTKDQYMGRIASLAAYYDNLSMRQWRDLEDTTNDPIIAERAGQSWGNYQGSEEYYDQGLLIWLDADTLIRQGTKGKKSLDDFARAFFGVNNGAWGEVTYGFDDVVKALNDVYPYDWATFLNTRLHDHGKGAPLDGITRAGYKLVYSDTPNDYWKARESEHKMDDFDYSIGFILAKDGSIRNVNWDTLAFKAGLTSDMKVIAVNGTAYDADVLKDAITAAGPKKDDKGGSTDPIHLLVKSGDKYKDIVIDYHGGLRYPSIVRIDGTPDLWSDIIAEKK